MTTIQNKKQPTEKDIQNLILEWLTVQGIFAWRTNAGTIFIKNKNKTRAVRLGMKGQPDISFLLKGGIAGFIEVKRKGGRLTQFQTDFLDKVRGQGAIAIIAFSLEDVIVVLKEWVL